MMKQKLIVVIGILTIGNSCGVQDLGKSECEIAVDKKWMALEDQFQKKAYDNTIDRL